MKEMLKKIISVSALFILFCNCIYVEAGTNEDTYSQDEAYEAYLAMSEKLQIRMDIPCEDYPDTFGGCYLDKDVLVILLTDMSPDVQQIYREACGNYNKLEFYEVDHSYEYLLELENMVEGVREEITVYEYYVDVQDNTFKIGVDQEELSGKPQLVQEEGLPIVIYGIDERPVPTAMKGGEAITNKYGSFSICFFGTYNGKKALVTCGHTNEKDEKIYYAGKEIGKVVKQNLRTYEDHDGMGTSYGDFSIVDISSSPVSTSSYVKWENDSDKYVTRIANVVVGLEVGMYGKESGFIKGTVKNTSITLDLEEPHNLSEYRVKGIVSVEGNNNKNTTNGDSGGSVVYTTSNEQNRIAGCIAGSKAGVCSYFTPVSYIESSGFTFY